MRENRNMMKLSKALGFKGSPMPGEPGVVKVELELGAEEG